MILLIDTDRKEIKVLSGTPDEDSVLEALDELSNLYQEYKLEINNKKHSMTYPVDFNETYTNSTIEDE